MVYTFAPFDTKVFRAALAGLLLMLALLTACGDPPPAPTPKTLDEGIAAISGVKAVELDPALIGDNLKQFPGSTVKMYSSDEAADKLFSKTEAAVTGVGYQKLDLPPGQAFGATAPGNFGGFYTKGETADVLLAVAAVPNDPAELAKSLKFPGATEAQLTKLAEQFRGKKSAIVTYSTPGLFSGLIKGFSGAGTTPTTKP